jgi:uncharacterized protein YjbI with pentapeptide repeats
MSNASIDQNSQNPYRGRDLRNENFQNLTLQGEDFSTANLSGANFTNAKIQGANFSNANLSKANFTNATAGLTRSWLFALCFIHLLLCLISTFTSVISITFFVNFFRTYNRKIPFLHPFSIFSIAFSTIVAFRTTLSNNFPGNCDTPMQWSVRLGIVAIIIILFFSFFTAFTSEQKDYSSFLITTGMFFTFLIFLQFHTLFSGLEDTLSGGGLSFVKQLGAKKLNVINDYHTNGSWLSMVFSSAIGGIFGYMISQSAIKNLRFQWLWNLYLKMATLKSTNFNEAKLIDAKFQSAILNGVNFEKAEITRTCWQGVKSLENSNASDSYLKYPTFRSIIVGENIVLTNQNFEYLNLRGIDLISKDLSGTRLIGTDLREANLKDVILKDANLQEAKLAGANLSGANLTGAIVHDWTIDEKTILSGIECDYVYLEKLPGQNAGRRRDPERGNFNPGEFEKRYGKNDAGVMKLEISRDFNEQAFRAALQQSIQGNDYQLRELEISGDDVIVKIKVPDGIEPNSARDRFDRIYQTQERQANPGSLPDRSHHEYDRPVHLLDLMRYSNKVGAKIIFNHNDNRTVNISSNGEVCYTETNNGTVQ